jgi:hypothetical protein
MRLGLTSLCDSCMRCAALCLARSRPVSDLGGGGVDAPLCPRLVLFNCAQIVSKVPLISLYTGRFVVLTAL